MQNTPEIIFRPAVPGDARRLAEFQIRAWVENYRDFLPRWTLDQVSVEDRSEAWRMILRAPQVHSDTEVHLAECNREIAGFGAIGRQRSDRLVGLGFGGEISAIYVAKAYQANGLGRRILARLFRRLKAMGETNASLWVIRDNFKARRFLEATGAVLLDPGAGGRYHAMDDVAYGWTKLDPFRLQRAMRDATGYDRRSLSERSVSLPVPEFAEASSDFGMKNTATETSPARRRSSQPDEQ